MDASHPFEYPEYEEHVVPKSIYFGVFITVAVAFVDLGNLNVVVALAVAVLKATLVVLFFMHVKYSPTLTKLVVISSIVWLGILFGVTLMDYLTRGWLMAPPMVH